MPELPVFQEKTKESVFLSEISWIKNFFYLIYRFKNYSLDFKNKAIVWVKSVSHPFFPSG